MDKYSGATVAQQTIQVNSEIARYEQLIEAAKSVNSTLDLNKLLRVISETARSIVNADRGTLYLIDDVRQELWSKVLNDPTLEAIRLPLGKGIAGHVAVTGETLNLHDVYSDPRFNAEFDLKSGYRTKTMLCMPLKNKHGGIVGVYQLLNKADGRFTAQDENFIDALSAHAAIAIENARLYEQERKTIAMEKELIAAREVQMSLIPKSLPRLSNFAMAARTIPAKEVGGDYYDVIRLDDHRYEVVIADVAGKGLPAAILAAMGKGVFHAQAIHDVSPTLHLKGSNKILRKLFPQNIFITMMIASVDDRRRTVTLANAGHCYPFVYRRATNAAELIPVRGMALNIADEISCSECTVTMEPGDSMVLYSDGVTEAQGSDDSFFETERLQQLIGQAGSSAPELVVQTVVDEIKKFSEGIEQSDDITLIVIKALSS